MKTKRKAIGSLLAASLVAIPSFFITSCEQDDGLGEYEMRQQYTLSRRMMGANGEPGGNPEPIHWSKIKEGTANGQIVNSSICSETTVTIDFSVSWPEIMATSMDDQNTHFVGRDIQVHFDNLAMKVDHSLVEVFIGSHANVSIEVDFHHISVKKDSKGIVIGFDTIRHEIREHRQFDVEYE